MRDAPASRPAPVRPGRGSGSDFPSHFHGPRSGPLEVLVPLEVLHRLLVLLRGGERLERAEVLPLSGLRVLLARVEAVPARLQLSDHDGCRCKSRTSKAAGTPPGESIGFPSMGSFPGPPLRSRRILRIAVA